MVNTMWSICYNLWLEEIVNIHSGVRRPFILSKIIAPRQNRADIGKLTAERHGGSLSLSIKSILGLFNNIHIFLQLTL